MNLELSKVSVSYMINLQLVKGTPLVFLDFAQNFFNLIESTIEQQRRRPRELPQNRWPPANFDYQQEPSTGQQSLDIVLIK